MNNVNTGGQVITYTITLTDRLERIEQQLEQIRRHVCYGGYTCGLCGSWVPVGTIHSCSRWTTDG